MKLITLLGSFVGIVLLVVYITALMTAGMWTSLVVTEALDPPGVLYAVAVVAFMLVFSTTYSLPGMGAKWLWDRFARRRGRTPTGAAHA